MKSKRIPLLKWINTDQTLDIDWPRLQQTLGQECVKWLNQQEQCQLVLEKQNHSYQLVAEFYNQKKLSKVFDVKTLV